MTADLALPPPDADRDEPPDPVYASVADWVTGQFLPVYRRPIGGEFRWCPKWWLHAEAITRLTALWQSWEAMRLQPGTGTANWLRDHLDHQLPLLLSRSGPFAQCSVTEHVDPRPAPAEPPPPGWWDDSDAGDEDDGTPPAPARPGPWTAGARHDGPPGGGLDST
jgi:hypothetical protein